MKIHWLTIVSNSAMSDADGKWQEMLRLAAIAEAWGLGSDWKPDRRDKYAVLTIKSNQTLVAASKIVSGNIMFKVTGRACDAIGTDALLNMVCKMSHTYHVTRIDVAHDVTGICAAEVWADAGQASAGGRKRNTAFFTDASGRSTAYFGSRMSDLYVRCYDRGAVMRFEIEVKGVLARSLLVPGLQFADVWGRLVGMLRRGEQLVNSSILSEALEKDDLGQGTFYSADAASDETSVETWFNEQVIPCFSKLAAGRSALAAKIIERMTNIYSAVDAD